MTAVNMVVPPDCVVEQPYPEEDTGQNNKELQEDQKIAIQRKHNDLHAECLTTDLEILHPGRPFTNQKSEGSSIALPSEMSCRRQVLQVQGMSEHGNHPFQKTLLPIRCLH